MGAVRSPSRGNHGLAGSEDTTLYHWGRFRIRFLLRSVGSEEFLQSVGVRFSDAFLSLQCEIVTSIKGEVATGCPPCHGGAALWYAVFFSYFWAVLEAYKGVEAFYSLRQ